MLRCRRPELREAVLALLAAHEKPDNILDGPHVDLTQPVDSSPGQGHPDATIEDAPAPPGQTGPANTEDGNSQHQVRGTTIRYFGDYEIRNELGKGGMGVVYKARQLSLNRPVALKLIKVGMLADADVLRRFRHEAESVALLDHPGIVPVYEVGDHDGQPYFSMKLIEGGNLGEHLARFHDNLRAAVLLLIEVAEAVQHAHTRGILHRDLKPANVLIDAAGHPHITDFGLAKWIEDDVEMTASGAIVGTPAYMSPEQAAGHRGSITTATDVYGLGAIFYALLTGTAPFAGDSVIETLDAVRSQPPERPTKRNAGIPRDLELICLKCLEKNPLDRYPTAAALADDLRRFAAGEPVSVRAAGIFERLAKWARRKPTVAATYTLGLLAVLLGSLGGTAAWQWRAADRARGVAEENRLQAVSARAEAERQREKVERIEYGRTIELAYQELRESNVPATLTLLERTRADLRGWEWDYVHALCHSDLLTLRHDGGVLWACFSPDGSHIVTASNDGRARVWDANSGEIVLTLEGSRSASYSRDGTRILTVDIGQRWTKVWNVRDGAAILTIEGTPGGTYSACFSPDGSRIVTADNVVDKDALAKVWDSSTGKLIHTLRGHKNSVLCVAYSPDGSRIVTGSSDGMARVWDAATGSIIRALPALGGFVHSVSFSPDGKRIVTANEDATRVWDAGTGASLLTIKGHSGQVVSASFSLDGTRIVTAGEGGAARVWEASSGAPLLTLKGHTGHVSSATFSPDGTRIVTASDDGTAKLWDAKMPTGANPKPLIRGGYSWLSPVGLRLLNFFQERRSTSLVVRDAESGAEISTLKGNRWGVISSAFSPDGTRIVTAGVLCSATVSNVANGAEIVTLQGQSDHVNSASFSPDGTRIVTASEDGTARIWDAQTGAEVLTLRGHTNAVVDASFSLDGTRIVTASVDYTARIWSVERGEELFNLKGHVSHVASASFSPDGMRVVTASKDGTAKVWDASTGAEVLTLTGHADFVQSASFSPDGSRIVTSGRDWTAKIWDAVTGAEVLSLRESQQDLRTASFSPDGSRVLVVDNYGTVTVWDARPINRQPKREMDLDSRLRAFLRGEVQLADNAERLALAKRAYSLKWYAADVRLLSEALKSNPRLGDDPWSMGLYNAACYAALAAAGQGLDQPPCDDAAKASFRRQALDWLITDLAHWAEISQSGSPQVQEAIVRGVKQWQADADLSSVRDSEALATLPEAEQKTWHALWADVDSLLKRAERKSK